MLLPIGPTELKMTVYDHTGALVILDATSDLIGAAISYEDTPSGCGSAQLMLGMTYEQVEAAGYYAARNIIELSSSDDELQTTCLAGATKLYVGSNKGYDTALGHDTGQIAMFDGATLAMRIPVTGVGNDAGGDFITIGTPVSGGTNPTTLPAYTAGTTIFRRRYSGIIMGRTRPNQKVPATVVRCAGLAQRINEAVCTFTLTTGTTDMGSAIYSLLSQFSSRWPELTISGSNFPATGQKSFNGSYDRTQIARVISDLISAANSGGDVWAIRVGHDRTPRLVKVYTSSGNTYAYNVTLPQGVEYFEPRSFVNTDQDASQLYNTVEVIGDTDPATQQPVTAIVQDTTSVSTYGQIDAQPVTNTACKTVAQCTLYGQALLNQQATPKANAQFVVSTRNDVSNAGPMGLSRGDVVLGLQNVTVTSFEGAAANVYGLASSVVTIISPAGDTVQNVRFSAIEPDWNEAMKERANALASSIIKNTATQAGITSYCVSAGAFIGVPSTTSLTVSVPIFAALFANGTAPITCGGNTFTLLSSSTNWVWLLSNGAWTVNQTPALVANAILYGIFTTSTDDLLDTESGIGIDTESGVPLTTEAGSIIGFIPKASIGVVELSQAQLPSMGSQGAPVLTSVSGISYPVVGNATYDAQVTFTVDVHSASWLVGIALFAVAHGSAADPRDFPKGQVDVGQSTAGVYTPIWKSIGAGNSEDLYVAYLDGQGRLSPVVIVGTTTANHAGYSALLGVPLTAPNPSSAASAFTYSVTGASTFDAVCTVNLDSNGTTANNALAEVETVIAPHASALTSTSDGWTPVGSVQVVNGTGVYNVAAGGLGAGTAYDFGVRYVGQNGSRSYVYIVGTTAANPQHLSNLPSMGSQAAPVTSSVSAISYPVVGNSTFDAVCTFTVDVASATWLVGLGLFAVAHGSGTDPRKSAVGFIEVAQGPSGTYSATWPGLGASNAATYDLYIAYEDAQGVYSPTTLIGTTVANPAGSSAFGAVGTTAPVISGLSAFTYLAVGASTYDISFSLTTDANGTTANNNLAELEVAIAPHSAGLTSTSTTWAPAGSLTQKNGTGAYTLAAGGLGAGTAYDVGLRYVGHTGDRSYVNILATTAANPQFITNLPSMGAQGAPVLSGVSSVTYPVIGNGTFDAVCTFTVDVHSATWLDGIILCAVAHSSGTDPRKSIVGFIDVAQSSAGTYTATWPGLGASNSGTYDLYVAYEDAQGVYSTTALVGTTVANPAGTSAFAAIATTAPNPSSAASAFSYAVNGGGTYDAECTIHLDANGTTSNNALAEIECVMAPHASGLTSTSDGWTPSGAPIAINGTGTYVTAWGGCGVQVQYDVGVRYIGHTGSRSYVYIIGTTTAAQLAQLPFVGVKIDPATGYIVISDQAVYPTGLQYQLSAAGVGSLLSAAMSVETGSTSVHPTVWLMYTSASGGNGYIAYWNGSNQVQVSKCASGAFTLLVTSTLTVAHDTTNFHNLELIATETTAGTVNLTAVLDGVIMCQASDSSTPYTSGSVAIQFRDATATNYIDEKTIDIRLGGSPSSSGIMSQGSIVPSSIPDYSVAVASQTYSTPGFRDIGLGTGTLQFASGALLPYNIGAILNDTAGLDGTWYCSLGLVLANLSPIYYLSQAAPTIAQLSQFTADGVLPIMIGESVTVVSGGISYFQPGYTSGGTAYSRRWLT